MKDRYIDFFDAVKEQPIELDDETLQAILEGRKTQFREPLKPQPEGLDEGAYCDPYNKNFEHFTFWTRDNRMYLIPGSIWNTAHWRPPYGIPGDRLWIANRQRASRIVLAVKNVRVETLQDIRERDAIAEGCKAWKGVPGEAEMTAVQAFVRLWDSLNDQRGFGWKKNPWVWVYEFEVMK
jgi:hypothetical protein